MILTVEHIKAIRDQFQLLRTKEDLLALLNFIAYPQLYATGYVPDDIDFSKIELPDDATTAEKLGLVFNSSSKKRRKQITAKQLTYFSTSFSDAEKKRKRYYRFHILKKSGKKREIHAPVSKLKQIQSCIYHMLQSVYETQPQAYGFVAGKSIADNASLHTGKAFVLNVDLKDFFPSVHFRRVKAMLEKPPFYLSGEKEPLAYLISNLCTENGVLPQGAPTSPFFTNVICQRLDQKLERLAKKFQTTYSRYADDLTFSANAYVFSKRFMLELEQIVKGERFQINEEKTRVQGSAYRQEVTGLTVNEKVNVNKHYLRSYRTLLHLYKTKGPLVAYEYHYKRMPESVRVIKQQRTVTSATSHIQNVIWGKYLFLKMIKGDSVPMPPFTRNKYAKMVIEKSISLIKPEPENITGDDDTKTETKKYHQPVVQTILLEASVPNEPVEPNTKKETVVEQLLTAWEKEGLEKAIELLKTKTT
ncbi:MAG: RNA-directed DNA polymerase [Chitinophagaceae bacterium]|nr:RNA-directed DNA polymerase [Chitinophagaceae bacterium]